MILLFPDCGFVVQFASDYVRASVPVPGHHRDQGGGHVDHRDQAAAPGQSPRSV